jgi:hypothetical protein
MNPPFFGSIFRMKVSPGSGCPGHPRTTRRSPSSFSRMTGVVAFARPWGLRRGGSNTGQESTDSDDHVSTTHTTPPREWKRLLRRRSEPQQSMRASAWGDIQFGASDNDPNRYILVQRNYVHGRFTTPQSKKSRRADMSRELRRVLLELRDKRMLEAFMKGKTSIVY